MDGQNRPEAPLPHVAPALTALILGIVGVALFGVYARSLEHRSIKALAADEACFDRDGKLVPVKNQGVALQRAAVETDGLLLVYGSSELSLQVEYNRPFYATNVFRDRPTGFTIFPVGKAGTTCLVILQKLAAVGPAIRGKKVAISLSPFWFFERAVAGPAMYAGNFSDLHAGELAFDDSLSFELRQAAARRMLQYPKTLANRPLVKFGLENLAEGTPLSLAAYQAAVPLGMIHNTIVRYQDHWSVVRYLWQHPPKRATHPSPQHGPAVDWAALLERAETRYRTRANNNEFGLDNQMWKKGLRAETLRLKNQRSDATFLQSVENGQEWKDLELLLRGLNELGAKPLLLSMPIHGGWYDQCGITYNARKAYYEKLRGIGARYHAQVADFADYDADRTFCNDTMGHLAPGGLVHYNQAYDAFFHNTLPELAELPALTRVASRSTEPGLKPRGATATVRDASGAKSQAHPGEESSKP